MLQPVQPARWLEKHVPIDQAWPRGRHNSPSSDDIPSSLESSAMGDHFGTPRFPPKDHPHVHRRSMLRDHSGETRKYRKPAAYGQYCISRHRTGLKTTNSRSDFLHTRHPSDLPQSLGKRIPQDIFCSQIHNLYLALENQNCGPSNIQFTSVQSLSRVRIFATP